MTEYATFLQHYWPDWLSLFSGFLLLALFTRPALPSTLWAWLLLSGLLSFCCTMGWLPVDVTAAGYVGNSWLTLLLPSLWICMTVGLAASGGIWPALAALLPAVLWRAGWSPAPGLFENYLDVPLVLFSLYRLTRRRPKQRFSRRR